MFKETWKIATKVRDRGLAAFLLAFGGNLVHLGGIGTCFFGSRAAWLEICFFNESCHGRIHDVHGNA